MGFLKIILSKIAGAIPSIYQLNSETWAWNERDGKAYGLKVNADGSKEVVSIGGGQGNDGEDAYCYIAYASDANGTGFTMVFNPDVDYIAIKSTNTAIPAPAAGDFAGLWKNYKGNTGDPGAPGQPGDPGSPGADGDDAYVYIAYASDANGTGFTMVFNAALDYIAIKSTTAPIANPAAGDFAGLWKNYKGNTGNPGAPGAPGADGDDAYVYIAYASDANGTGFTMIFNEALDYIAIKNSTVAIANPNAATFAGLWKKYKGEQGEPGEPGEIDLYNKWNFNVEADGGDINTPVLSNEKVYFKKGKGINFGRSSHITLGHVMEVEATGVLEQPSTGTAEGFKHKLIANEAQNFGDLCFVNAAGKAQRANATVKATANVVAMCLQSVNQNAEGLYLILGKATLNSWTWAPGGLIYLSTDGTINNTLTQSAPSGTVDFVIQVIGKAITATTILFIPSLSQVEYK